MPCVHFLCRHRPCVAVFVNKRKKFISLHSEVLYHKIIREICEKYGKDYTKDLQTRMTGTTDREICVTVVDLLKLPISVDEFEKQLTDLAQKLLPSAPLLKGAKRLLTHLHDYKVPMALATNSTEQAVRLHALSRPKLFGMFHHKCLVFEDSVVGVEAAIKAGMQVVMTPGPRLQREHTRHATLVIKSLLDFKPELFGLPPFDKTLNKATEITNK
uniref:Pseudouridine-5'-phosphatase n=1 Tax=Bombyx mori TaxID=7091 RepID=A0A8R2R7S0_BOMMO|nr:pseudouridine-5'-phosphatase isoform X4 [Bombyx mori]